jgi:tetratricopeptide (TPR) repeat protein
MLIEAAREYKAALKFTPNDGALHLGLGNTYLRSGSTTMRLMNSKSRPKIPQITLPSMHCLRGPMRICKIAIKLCNMCNSRNCMLEPCAERQNRSESTQSEIYVSTGEALSTVGDHAAAMERFRKALAGTG